MSTYRDLIVWRKAVDLVVEIYKITEQFPREEVYGLVSQMRRAAVSIPSNIAEGKMRGYPKECKQFFLIAFASGAELETQIIISKKLPKTTDLKYEKADLLLQEVMRMLNSLISKA